MVDSQGMLFSSPDAEKSHGTLLHIVSGRYPLVSFSRFIVLNSIETGVVTLSLTKSDYPLNLFPVIQSSETP